jgi:hypothetical protein
MTGAGDPGAGIGPARAIAEHLALLADGMDAAARGLPSGAPGWKGLAAAMAGQVLAAEPARFAAVADAFRAGALALARHADALATASVLYRRAEEAPGRAAAALRGQAEALAADSARRTAAEVHALAARAPAEPGRWHRWRHRLAAWPAEIRLGTAEAIEGLASTAGPLVVRLVDPTARAGEGLRAQASALTTAIGHPMELTKAVVDWDTWRANPARAIGHLTPDLLLAMGTGGTAAAVRSSEIASRQQISLAAALERDATARSLSGARAGAARRALIEESATVAGPAKAWAGEGGTGLTAAQNARAEAFHRLSTARADGVARAVEEAARAAGGRLRGLPTRLKSLDSFRRKVSTVMADTGQSLSRVLKRMDDTVRHTIELPDRDYVRGAATAARRLQDLGFHPRAPYNAWHSGRYRGLNSAWVDPASGVSFEVQFHTPASWAATVRTHDLYEVFRRPSTDPRRRVEIGRAIGREFETAPPPGWVQTLRGRNFPPPMPDPIVTPPSLAAPVAAAGAAAAHALVSADRATPKGRSEQ